MPKPDKTQLLNSYVAHSMNAWAKATIDLDQERNREHPRSGAPSIDDPALDDPATSPDSRVFASIQQTPKS